jgi:hypothetical protein
MDIGIYADRETLLKIAEQIRIAFEGTSGHTDTVVYGKPNSILSSDGISVTFSNDDSEPDDGGYQGGEVLVDVNE